MVGRGAAGALRAGPLEKGPGSEPAPFLDRLLSPALSSTFCGGEGDKSSRWDRSDKDSGQMRPFQRAATAFDLFGRKIVHHTSRTPEYVTIVL